jgi:hypothetical protein
MEISRERFNELGLGYDKESCRNCVDADCCEVAQKLFSFGYNEDPFCPSVDEERLRMEMTEEEYDAWRHNRLIVEKQKYYVTYKVEARYVVEVDANSMEEAMSIADGEFSDADFGSAEDIEGEAIIVEDDNDNYLWEKE